MECYVIIYGRGYPSRQSRWIRSYFLTNDSQHTKAGRDKLDFRFFLLLYGTPVNSAESQILETWPASHYGHLRESAD